MPPFNKMVPKKAELYEMLRTFAKMLNSLAGYNLLVLFLYSYFVKQPYYIRTMLKRSGFNNDKLKRIHRKEVLFNTSELEAINTYCKRYRIKNRSKFLREAVISKVLQQFDNDHPKLF